MEITAGACVCRASPLFATTYVEIRICAVWIFAKKICGIVPVQVICWTGHGYAAAFLDATCFVVELRASVVLATYLL